VCGDGPKPNPWYVAVDEIVQMGDGRIELVGNGPSAACNDEPKKTCNAKTLMRFWSRHTIKHGSTW
jgi:hypothetical protein